MSKTKFSQRRENAVPVRRSSWGNRQLRPNASNQETPEHLAGLPTLEEFGAFFSSVRGVPTVVAQSSVGPILDKQPLLGIRFCDAEQKLGCVVLVDLISINAIGGSIRRFRTSDIRHKLEMRVIDDETLKAWRYVGHRLADMVSSTHGPRLYFDDLTEPMDILSAPLRSYFERAHFRMSFTLGLKPFGEGHLGVAMGL